MQATGTLKLYALDYKQLKTYAVAVAFIACNIIFPQLCHLANMGGQTWLPIYFFTLIGAYKYGWRVGLLTAVASPLANCAIFGMPAAAMLPAILIKSGLLAIAAGVAASHLRRAPLAVFIAIVAFYQVVGGLGEWALTGSLDAAMQDFRLGLPGMLLQIVGGWLIINRLIRK